MLNPSHMDESLQEDSVAEIEAAWTVEIRERVAAFERGELETYPAAEVLDEARRIAK